MKPRKFFLKLFLFSIPFIALLGLYFILDPFKVLRHYNSYYISGEPSYISLNKDYISTQNWINHYPEHHYEAYIFGNSRSMYYQIDAWKDHINTPYEKCYHFDASAESLYGIEKKLAFLLDTKKVPVKHVMIVIDDLLLNQVHNSAGHLFAKHPAISGQNKLSFQLESVKSFFDFKFLTSYLDFRMSGKVKPYMKKDFLLDDRPFYYDPVVNEIQQKVFEEKIKKNPDDYYLPMQAVFYQRDTTHQVYADQVIHTEQMELLNSMKKKLADNQVSYKIVVSPLYDQKKLNKADLQVLQTLFGAGNVFDFSGINTFTNNPRNYYETSHYRPHVAAAIMDSVYANP